MFYIYTKLPDLWSLEIGPIVNSLYTMLRLVLSAVQYVLVGLYIKL